MQKTEKLKKIKFILMLVGGLLIIGTGLLYAVISDLVLLNNSTWLFLAMITALGSGGLFLLSEKFKTKPKYFYLFKWLSAFLLLMFIFIILGYRGGTFINSMFGTEGADINLIVTTKRGVVASSVKNQVNALTLIIIILGSLGLLSQLTNITLNIIDGIDE